MKIKRYTSQNKKEVINLLKLNTPNFFDPSEEQDFSNYLDNEVEDYFVIEENSKIIGAGGINYFPDEKIARISWDIIAPDSQGKGIGKKLTEFRINHLKENLFVNKIVIRTSQFVYKFYEKMGFKLEIIEKDYWAENFDLYQMTMRNHRN